MKYFFRDRVKKGGLLSVFVKDNPAVRPDHHDYHPHYELYFRKESMPQEIVLNGRTVKTDRPAAVLTAPFSIHAMSPAEENTAKFERQIVYFSEAFRTSFGERILPSALFRDGMNCLYELTPTTAATLSDALVPVFDETLPEAERALALAGALCKLNRTVPQEDRTGFGGISNYIPAVLQYLYRNCATDLKSDTIAQRFHVSRAKLDRDFTASVGQTLHQAVLDLRAAKAKELLVSTSLPIPQIAAETGFASEYYFYAFFRRITGKTPLQWRKNAAR